MTPPGAPDERLSGIKAVLFDFDGTLADTIPHILASFRHASADVLGKALPDDELLRDVGMPLAQQMLVLSQGEPEVAERLLASYRTFNHATHDAMARLYPGAVEVLSALQSRGMPMGVVTSKGTPMAMNRAVRHREVLRCDRDGRRCPGPQAGPIPDRPRRRAARCGRTCVCVRRRQSARHGGGARRRVGGDSRDLGRVE
jgi:hypothetical protein